jgi:hypothetical protein
MYIIKIVTKRIPKFPRSKLITADWDHEIYSPMTDLHNDNDYECYTTEYVKWDYLPKDYRWAASVPLGRWIQKGNTYPNIDITTINRYRKEPSPPPSPPPVPPEPVWLLGQSIGFWDRLRRILGFI